MEIRNQVHDADENTQTYRHRETDDGKTDAAPARYLPESSGFFQEYARWGWQLHH